jgi:hypothetical protein
MLHEERLDDVHRDLVKVIRLAAERSPIEFCIGEGKRSLARQRELVAAGRSQTMHSRHLTGHAVDLFVMERGKVSWEMPKYKALSTVVLECARDLGVQVEWGGNWKTLKDGPHFQLSKAEYPE